MGTIRAGLGPGLTMIFPQPTNETISSSQSSSSSQDPTELAATKKFLKPKDEWNIVSKMFKQRSFDGYLDLTSSYELHMSFFVKGSCNIQFSTSFASALSVAVKWLKKNRPTAILPCLTTAYLDFFASFTPSSQHSFE